MVTGILHLGMVDGEQRALQLFLSSLDPGPVQRGSRPSTETPLRDFSDRNGSRPQDLETIHFGLEYCARAASVEGGLRMGR